MSDPPPGAAAPNSLAAGSAALRDTAKWIVGGVVGTAAGVFAGSSLTNLGSLTLPDDWLRILVVIIGAVAGFWAIGSLAWRALAVLTIKTLSFEELVNAIAHAQDTVVHKVATELQSRFAGIMPGESATFSQVLEKIVSENRKTSDRDAGFAAEARAFLPDAMTEATFMRVAEEFDALKRVLPMRSIMALIGFGAFAWGANPPERSSGAAENRGMSISVSLEPGLASTNAPSSNPDLQGRGRRQGETR